jgi:phospholipase C
LPYDFEASARLASGGLALTITNSGAAGAGFGLYPARAEDGGPWFYAVEAGKTLQDRLSFGAAGYDLALHGPNGFLRQFRGGQDDGLAVESRYDLTDGALQIRLRNVGVAPVTAHTANAYAPGETRTHRLAPGAEITDAWPIAAAGHWYDITVGLNEDPRFLRRLAGHIETGRPSRSDPALDGRAAG